MRLVHVVGVRPNFMKIAPIMRALSAHASVEQLLVHTGQHYDRSMSQIFFEELGLPRPDFNLGIGAEQSRSQTGRMVTQLERLFGELRPDCVVVVGDVNSTMAGALVAAKLGIRSAHVEAGLRSFDRSMPEEINRLVTDRIANLLLTPSPDADVNLLAEGVRPETIRRVGNVMVDTLLQHLELAKERNVLQTAKVEPHRYAVLTLHRPSNVDDRRTLESLIDVIEWVQEHLKVVFPLHPRTHRRLLEFSLYNRLANKPNLVVMQPQGYLDFLSLVANAKLVITDSGGLQEETTVLGVPCLTLRSCTERPITVSVGTNVVVGSDPEGIRPEVARILAGHAKKGRVPDLWDGAAGERVADAVLECLMVRAQP